MQAAHPNALPCGPPTQPQAAHLLNVDGAQLLQQLKLLWKEAALTHRRQDVGRPRLDLRRVRGGRQSV